MEKTTDFQLKAGAVLTFFGSPIAYTNANLTDEVALRYLAQNKNNSRLFSHLPADWENRLSEYTKISTNDNGRNNSEAEAAIIALKDKLEEMTESKSAVEVERDNLKKELAGANSSLESALMERDSLAAENATLKEERDSLTAEKDALKEGREKLLAEVESLKSKTTSRAKKATPKETTTKETTPAASSEQSLDL